jgi:putative nucleotidyltransferase with HDIG domain
MQTTGRTEIIAGKFLPIYLEALRIDTIVDFDLYIKIGTDLILYRASDLPFTDKTRATLLENNVDRLYVPVGAQARYQHYIESNITQILKDRSIPEPTKAGIVYDSTKLLIKDVLANPTLSENVRRSQTMVESQVAYILTGPQAFHNLLRVMSFDYYTYTHSVNVCTFSVAFAQHIGVSDEETLSNLGTGALLHDIGKTKISDRILNKKSKLSPMEMDIVRRHPEYGVELMKETGMIAEESYIPIIQHHEREDGSGYPNGMLGSEMHIFGRVVAIADCFDAMTTRRVYQPAVETFPALKVMFQQDGAFERKLLERFAFLMGPQHGGMK